MPIPLAADFLASSLLSLLLPAGLVVVIATWYALVIRHGAGETPRSAPTLPPEDVLAAGVQAGIESAQPAPEPPAPPADGSR